FLRAGSRTSSVNEFPAAVSGIEVATFSFEYLHPSQRPVRAGLTRGCPPADPTREGARTMNGVTHNRMQSPWDIKNPPELMRKAGSHGGTVNVSTPGRIASVVGGGALAAYGLTRGTLAGVGLSILGGT